ncbi:unnamed protein product [Nippostrongylus brasiliensis]|uniref:YTH domain-containing protein n=1 Tax=Nippostrongylus brasiliensis TaxID=27835 RepID=A0A158R0H7_NIPBR|nr:unnamed protein product [Nippostrongylus brasiliensis]
MIGLVWSLVSSVVETTRRRKLAVFLADFLAHVSEDGLMIVCRRIADPQLPVGNNNKTVLYRNERAEVAAEKAEPLKPSQWRFAKGSVTRPSLMENKFVFFVAERRTANDATVSASIADFDAVPYCSVFLDSSCERVGWHRFANASLYSCPLEHFIDVVYAFSEGALFDNVTDARLIDSLYTVSIPFDEISESVLRADSPLARSLTHLNKFDPAEPRFYSNESICFQRPLSLLEQLYLGDARPWLDVRGEFVSETALHAVGADRRFDSLPRRRNQAKKKKKNKWIHFIRASPQKAFSKRT